MSHREREKTGVSSYQGRGKPPSNPDATVFVGNVGHSCVVHYLDLSPLLSIPVAGLFNHLAETQGCV